MQIGLTHSIMEKVSESNTASNVGSGLLDVYATPSMIALMEKCASESVAPFLDDGCTTVGSMISAKHLSPTPIGKTITCRSKLTAIDGRKLTFEISVSDDAGPVGEAVHERFIIDSVRFLSKCESKYN